MIQTLTEDDDGNTVFKFDDEGIENLMDGLLELYDNPVGTVLSTPAVWSVSTPWWKFWNRTETPVVGEIQLHKIA